MADNKEAVKATLQALAKGTSPALQKVEKAIVVKKEVQLQAPKAEVKEAAKPAPETKPEAPKVEKAEAKAEANTEAKARKEADPAKEFVDGIMAEMNLKGASKKRLIKNLAEQYNFDKQKVLFRLRRALITERYAAAHAEGAGH